MSMRAVGVFAAVLLVGGCSRDFQLPEAGDGPIADLRVSPDPARAGVDLMIEFATSATPTGDPVVEIAGRFASKLSGPDEQGRFVYRLIPSGDEPEGQETPVVVSAILGQEARATTTVTFDFTPPQLITSSLTPPIAAAGETITLTLDADEILSAPAVSSRDLTFDCLPESESGSDQRFLCTATPAGTEIQGPYSLDVLLRDLAGNETSLVLPAAGELRFGNAPVVTDLRATPLIARAGDTVTVEFVADRPLAAGSRVHLGASDFLQTAETELVSGWAYTYTHLLTGAEPEGLTEIEVLAEDVGGATRSETFAIELDFTAPALLQANLSAERVGAGGAFEATVVGSEALASVSGSVGFPSYQLPMRCQRDGTFTWICHYDALGLEPEETPLNVALVLEDLAGNTALATTDPVTFDFTCRYPGAPIRAVVDWRDDIELVAEAGAFEAGATVEITEGQGGAVLQTRTADASGAIAPVALVGVSEVWVQGRDVLGNACPPLQPRAAFRADGRGTFPGSGLPNPTRYQAVTLDQRLMPLAGLGATEVNSAAYRDLDHIDGSPHLRSEAQQPAGTQPRWWTPSPATVPPERDRHVGTYHRAMRRFVVSGGRDSSYSPHADTWAWDGHAWTEPFALSPFSVCDAQLVYDEGRERAYLFSGRVCGAQYGLVDPMWSLGVEGWRQELVTPGLPPATHSYASVYDPVRQEILMAGGLMLSSPTSATAQLKTWAWTGGWREVPTGIFWADSGAMAFDRGSGVVIHYGSRDPSTPTIYDDTCTWAGADWNCFFAQTSPGARYEHVMAYDLHRERTIVWGGYGPSVDSTIWEWVGGDWSPASSLGDAPPETLAASTAGYDEVRGRTVFMGGEGTSSYAIYWEVYEYGYPWRFPMLQAHLAGKPGLPATVEQITVSAVAAGSGASLKSAGVTGVELLLWDRISGNWDVVASNTTSDLGGPQARLDFEVSDPALLSRYFDAGSRSAEALVRPREGATHLGASTLTVDALWMTLDGP
ncbi:MAG: hypothetical protein P1V51_24745 [Deltaproteobacteria bacterium]|nr:hypothetical protein [Deltaproteobacteria bacterium]